ncbi:hypothetical protein [Vibrio alginolyticus]|uniref:hypothetical protein n=1 Tax=Vibrio alginolyticus TaxID=663 RepID=UPI0007205540|nr:hypothetical protein [Vibrio alginolyticus]ALR95469.1 hypothetical protein AT730_24270 [Vibrio alginolyticus]MBY7710032.1 hypothetical protein [Vibrio alginolyticus]
MKKYNYYPVFYTKGVNFWNELDKKLLNNGVSLIELFPYLSGNNEDGLPTIFIDKVVSIIGEVEWNNLEKIPYLIASLNRCCQVKSTPVEININNFIAIL